MRRVVRIDWNEGRPGGKVYVAGRLRLHHGLVGATGAAGALCYLAAHDAPWAALGVLAVGLALAWHDRLDAPWLNDRDAFRFIGPR